MLKWWRITFDPSKDYFQLRHLWVLLPGLPLQWWNKWALVEIANRLMWFLSMDEESILASEKHLCRVPMEIDIHASLLEEIELEWRGMPRVQRLDFLGIHFSVYPVKIDRTSPS
jgi:hypothetical protein